MKNILFASPLYILRKECSEDLFAVLTRLSEIGFNGVEFLGFFGKNAEAVHEKMEELHMVPVGNHVDFNTFLSDMQGTIEFHKKVGCRYITIGNIPRNGLPGNENYPETVKRLIEIGTACSKEGITLLYHNHGFELSEKVNGKYMLEAILDDTPEDSLAVEPDLGWMAIGGADPVFFLEKYRSRCPVIHLKDFYASDISKVGNVGDLNGKRGSDERGNFEFRPVGYGIMNTPAHMVKVLNCNPHWLVMDHDLAYERNSYDDLQLSLQYVKQLLKII